MLLAVAHFVASLIQDSTRRNQDQKRIIDSVAISKTVLVTQHSPIRLEGLLAIAHLAECSASGRSWKGAV